MTDKALLGLADFGINLTTADPNIARAIFRYSELHGLHASKSVRGSVHQAQAVHSTLQPPLFNNVTKGQAAKLRGSQEHGIVLETGLGILTPVAEADIDFDNGIIHAIDSNMVLPHNISETARLSKDMTLFAELLSKSQSISTLETLSDATFFIPQDSAILALSPVLDMLTSAQLASIVKQHAVPNQVLYQNLIGETSTRLETLAGTSLQVRRGKRGEIYVDGAEVVRTDILLYGGVAHLIDQVLLPDRESTFCDTRDQRSYSACSGEKKLISKAWSVITSQHFILGATVILAAVTLYLRKMRALSMHQRIVTKEEIGEYEKV
ncbi:Putative FAS1 domain-containing protein [Septoria linicola]|uniref:FAS1 domain-containing protein n=1 Tax=Septoria linicola TaxID=215465 RepID=A0A9Q9AK66_9PEZI|nr:Putative FAS1 domain-containing protein [Septoria linicola]